MPENKDLVFACNRRQECLMKNSPKNVLPFPIPPKEPGASTIVIQIGDERFAIHWEIEELPPVPPLLPWKTAKIVK
jgi:hypothetical protein